MGKYLLQVSYKPEGTQGLLKDGGTKRRKAAEDAVKAAGGSLESFYYALGEYDAYVIAEIPDNVSAMAMSMVINASGAVALKTTPLLTVEDMDTATKKKIGYRKPGSK